MPLVSSCEPSLALRRKCFDQQEKRRCEKFAAALMVALIVV
jgi:hypothetical protein